MKNSVFKLVFIISSLIFFFGVLNNPVYADHIFPGCGHSCTENTCGDSTHVVNDCYQAASGDTGGTCTGHVHQTCATAGGPYNQCGGTCNGTSYASSHTVSVTPGGGGCSGGSCQGITYSCSDLGTLCGQCGNAACAGDPQASPQASYPSQAPYAAAQTPKAYWNSDNIEACTTLWGWTCDPDKYSQALNVHFYYTNSVRALVSADYLTQTVSNVSRDDNVAIGNQCGGTSPHGFSLPTPNSLKDGATHYIYAFALGIRTNGTEDGANTQLDLGTPTYKTITCPVPPTITSLQVTNGGLSGTFTGTVGVSGRTSTTGQGGSNWYNPMIITLNATGGNGTNKQYYTAFYDKKEGTASIQSAYSTASTFLTSVQGLLKTNPNAGWLLRYDEITATTGNYYVWDYSATSGTDCISGKGCFKDITDLSALGWNINQGTNLLYRVFPTTNPKQWQVRIDKNFGSKQMYTAGYVVSSNGSDIKANLNP